MALQLNVYLSFRDEARQAMEFYRSIFGGDLSLTTFGESHGSDDPADRDKIMHAELTSGAGLVLMASDTPAGMSRTPGTNFSLSLSGDDDPTLRGYFDALADGGTVAMPLGEVPWGGIFGMCTDRFGIQWMVSISTPAE